MGFEPMSPDYKSITLVPSTRKVSCGGGVKVSYPLDDPRHEKVGQVIAAGEIIRSDNQPHSALVQQGIGDWAS